MFVRGKTLEDLIIKPTYYAPVLQVKEDGDLTYARVTEYSSRWLERNEQGELERLDEYESLDPCDLWMDHRWLFIRRMSGDTLCQKVLYGVCTFIWIANGIEMGPELKKYQDAVIENVFQYKNKFHFLSQEKLDTEVTTFDGQFTGFLCWGDLKKLLAQVSVLGPIAGMCGRRIEQLIMNPKGKTFYIPEREFALSVDAARICLKKELLQEHLDETTTEHSE